MLSAGVHTSQHLTGEALDLMLTARAVGAPGQPPQISIGGAAAGVHLVLGIEEAAMLLDSLDQALAVAQERHLRVIVNGGPRGS